MRTGNNNDSIIINNNNNNNNIYVKGLNPGVISKSVEFDHPGERSPE